MKTAFRVQDFSVFSFFHSFSVLLYGHVVKGQMALHRNHQSIHTHIVLVITLENEYGMLNVYGFSMSAENLCELRTHVRIEPKNGYQDLYLVHFARTFLLAHCLVIEEPSCNLFKLTYIPIPTYLICLIVSCELLFP